MGSETSDDALLSLEWVKAGLGVQPGSFFIFSSPAERTTSGESQISPNRLLRASHRQGLTRTAPEPVQIYLIHRNKYKEASKVGRQKNRLQMKEQENTSE